MQITRLKPANIEAIIEHLIFRIRASNRAHNAARSFGWLFVHGFEEGASFEFGAGAAVSDPQLLLDYETGGEIWNYADAYENEADDEAPGDRALEGVATGSGRRKRSNCPAIWRLADCFQRREMANHRLHRGKRRGQRVQPIRLPPHPRRSRPSLSKRNSRLCVGNARQRAAQRMDGCVDAGSLKTA